MNNVERCRDYYRRNADALNARRRETRAVVQERMRELKSAPCTDCGGSFPSYVMDWDHRDPATKEFDVGARYNSTSWERVLREIEKCDLVCANCHRVRTWG